MNSYRKKNLWKWLLFVVGSSIVIASFWYTSILVKRIADDERKKIEIWAQAIQQKARLMNYTSDFFKKIEQEERKRVEIWAEATRRIIEAGTADDLSFYSMIISGNTTIPVVLTDRNLRINAVKNVDFSTDSVGVLKGEMLKEFSKNAPIQINYGPITNYLFFKESKLFSELRVVINDLTKSFFDEVVVNSANVPVIITDSSKSEVYAFGGIDSLSLNDSVEVVKMIHEMESQNAPIIIRFDDQPSRYIYYRDSELLVRLQYYPIVQFAVIGAFLLVAYILFSISRRAEQNKVWVGMARETAHQLGTPISSLLAWIDFIPETEENKMYLDELRHDVARLTQVSERFSNIGSKPELTPNLIIPILQDSLDYIKARSPKSIQFSLNDSLPHDYQIAVNVNLFRWVLENLMKNSVDAIEHDEGKIELVVFELDRSLIIEVSDNGKGISKKMQRMVFNPGFTTKKRGWGLGLALCKRIITEYHRGKIILKQSIAGKGTTFKIVLKNKGAK